MFKLSGQQIKCHNGVIAQLQLIKDEFYYMLLFLVCQVSINICCYHNSAVNKDEYKNIMRPVQHKLSKHES